MSRNTTRRRVIVQELIDELSIAAAQRLRTDSDTVEPIVRAVVAYLIDEYPAQDLYIPAHQEPRYPVERIHADLDAKASVRAICQRYRVGRGTVYRIIEERRKSA